MDLNIEFIHGPVVLDVSVEPVRLFHKDGAAYAAMLPQVRKHLAEMGSAALLGGLDVGEFLGDHIPIARGVLAKEAKLRCDAEPLLLLILTGYSRVQYNLGHTPRRSLFRPRHCC